MYLQVETISPEIAKAFLVTNKNNRPLKSSRINLYAEQMRNGEWYLTEQGISFSKEGYLRNGQHRLHAIIKAGVSVKMSVIYDCEDSAFEMLDVGVNRTIKDITGLSENITATVKSVISEITENMGATNIQTVLKVYNKNKELFDKAGGGGTVRGITAAVRKGFFCYLKNGGNSSDITRFVSHVNSTLKGSGKTDHNQMGNGLLSLAMVIIRNDKTRSSELAYITFKALSNQSNGNLRSYGKEKTMVQDLCFDAIEGILH